MGKLEITVIKDGKTLLHEVSEDAVIPAPVEADPLNLYRAPQLVDGFVSSYPQLKAIADQPTGKWLGEWSGDIKQAVAEMAKDAKGKTLILIAYNIPNRDDGQYSAGGAASAAEYLKWIDGIVEGLGDAKAIIILEPDALGHAANWNDERYTNRMSLIHNAILKLDKANIQLFVDASTWVEAGKMATMLKAVTGGTMHQIGFSCNVSGYMPMAKITPWAEAVAKAANLVDYVVDTSRNGVGGNDGDWCNPTGQGLGMRPQPIDSVATPHMWAALWLKAPGESDGTCNGGPAAGQFWLARALELVKNDAFPEGGNTTQPVDENLLGKIMAIAAIYGDHYQQMNQIRDLFGMKRQ